MNETVIYLIRHAETVEENGIRNTSENSQMINEKEILSIKGEEQSKKLSENTELQNLDDIWTSHYTRAKATAKYMDEKVAHYEAVLAGLVQDDTNPKNWTAENRPSHRC